MMMIRSIKLLSLLLTVLLASFSRWQVQSFAVAAEKNRFGSRLALFPRKTEINQSTIASHDRLDDAKPKSYFTQFYNWYNDCLLERPILTKGVTAGVVNLLGDTLAQYIAASKTGAAFVPDVVRLQAFFLCGLVYTGPMVHWWNEQLIKFGDWIKENYSSRNQVQVLAQLGLDQTVGVVLLTCTYFYAFELIEALVRYRMPVLSSATAKIIESFRTVILINYCIWPLVNWISFTYVPVQFRVLLNNIVGVFWGAFLSAKIAG